MSPAVGAAVAEVGAEGAKELFGGTTDGIATPCAYATLQDLLWAVDFFAEPVICLTHFVSSHGFRLKYDVCGVIISPRQVKKAVFLNELAAEGGFRIGCKHGE